MARKGKSNANKTKIEISVPSNLANKQDWENWGKSWEKNWQHRQRTGMLWFGLFLLAVGALWYATTLGLVLPELVCPGLVIIVGALVLLRALISYIIH